MPYPTPGATLRALKPFRVTRLVSVGPSAWGGEHHDVAPGDVLTYSHQGRGWGSDPALAWFVTIDGERWTIDEGWRGHKIDPANGYVEVIESVEADA